MLIDFFYTLRSAKLPVSVKEFLTLLEAVQAGVVGPLSTSEDGTGYSVDDFYYLSRTALVKDEKHFDKFDRAFAAYFKGIELIADFTKDIPLEWLRKNLELELSPEERAKIEKMGWDELMETLKKRFEEQKERHEGGSKWIGTGGTSPFGAYGINPQGIRIGQDKSRNKSAVKVWDQRAYKDYDDTQELGTRNIKIALRRLRKFAREGAHDELDLDDTIRSPALGGHDRVEGGELAHGGQVAHRGGGQLDGSQRLQTPDLGLVGFDAAEPIILPARHAHLVHVRPAGQQLAGLRRAERLL